MSPARNRLFFVIALALFLLAETVLIKLAWWQYSRMHERAVYEQTVSEAMNLAPIEQQKGLKDNIWRHVILEGHFDNQRSVLLSNQRYQGRVGWRLFTPFISGDVEIIIDRGWIAGAVEKPSPKTFMTNISKVEGVVRALPQRNGWLKGPVHDVSADTLLFLDIDAIEAGEMSRQPVYVQAKTMTHSGVTASITALDAGSPHKSYMLTWLSLAILLPILFIWRVKSGVSSRRA